MHQCRYINFFIIILLCFLITGGCQETNEPEDLSGRMPLVIEGWIEENEYPIVMVTRALDLNDENIRLEDAVEKWCRVTIFDNDIPYILTARKNEDYKPSFIFTTTRLRGKVGHTYRLTVETEDTIATAVSVMPLSGTFKSFKTVPATDCDSLFTINAYFTDLKQDGYYKIFCKSTEDRRHYASFLGNFRGYEYDDNTGINISRGTHSAFTPEDHTYTHFFKRGDYVEVKLCSTEKSIYDFWTRYDLNVSLSHNMFMNFISDCPGNIKGAKGYWAAYGCSMTIMKIPSH